MLCAFLRVDDPPDPGTPQAYRDHRRQDAEPVAAQIRAGGGRAVVVEADLSDPASPALLFDTAQARLGPVDILVNNATGWVADTFAPTGGVTYEIDLNARHAAKLRKTLAPFEAAARRVGGRSTRRATVAVPAQGSRRSARQVAPAPVVETPVDPAAVRAWATAHKITVSTRGRVPAAVVAQFRAAGN